MVHPVRYWTPEDIRALPEDGNRYECIDGALLVTPAPSLVHQRALTMLFRRLDDFVRQHGLGEILWSPADLELVRGTLVQPDLFVYYMPTSEIATAWSDVRALRVAVEVLSPSTLRNDRGRKRQFYLRAPVDEYWIVDCAARAVERWRQGRRLPEVLGQELCWQPIGAPAMLRIDLRAFFAAVHGV